jgi:PAS domain S-box-containing protein
MHSGAKRTNGMTTEHDGATSPERKRLAAYEAALAVASEVDLDAVLQRIVDLACEVADARYGALGVTNDEGRVIRFITAGITPAQRAALGPIPQGHGLIGALIHDRTPLLVPNIAADSRSVGFPANHPPMTSLLGVPILLGGRVLGNLYLTDRRDGQPFTADDLDALQIVAAHAATAIERAQLYQELAVSRRQAEAERDHFRIMLESLPAAAFLVGQDNEISFVNDAARTMIFGDHPVDRLPRYREDFRWLETDGQPISEQRRPGVHSLHHGNTSRNQQLVLERADGSRVPAFVHSAPMADGLGTRTRALVVFEDATWLRKADQLKDDFLALISHEFRTPLTAIHGGAHMLARDAAALDPGTRQELLTDIVTESERLEQMLNNLMSATAIQAGRLDPATEPIVVSILVRKVMREIRQYTPGYRFTVDIPSSLPAAEGDPELLAQVLRNLFENAVKYMPGGGEIATSAHRDGQRITISVTDHGIGIAPEHVGSVFERFRRVGGDPTVRGMGLGLYLSRLLIEAQGGRITVTSPGIGQGSTFSVALPISPEWDASQGE